MQQCMAFPVPRGAVRALSRKPEPNVTIIADPAFYAAAIPAVILLGLAKGGFAGLGTASTPLLALYLPPLEAAALLLPVLMTQDAISLVAYRRHWDANNLKVILPGGLIGMGLGWLLAAYVSDNAVRLIVGLIGLIFVLNVWLAPRRIEPHHMHRGWGVFWGGVSGFTSFMTQGGGPPFQVYVLPQMLPKLVVVGTTTIFFAIINVLKIGPYFWLGQFNASNFATSLALLPAAIAANFAGMWLIRRMPTTIFYNVAYVLLLLISLMLLWQARGAVFS